MKAPILQLTVSDQRYRDIMESREDYPVFLEPWWLDATCRAKNWHPGILETPNGRAFGVLTGRLGAGREILIQPPFTQLSGIWFFPSAEDPIDHRPSHRERFVGEAAAAEMEQWKRVDLRFPPEVVDWLPWYWRGYSQQTRYSYRIACCESAENQWKYLRTSHRRNILRGTREGVEVRETCNVEKFLVKFAETFQRKEKKLPIARPDLHRLVEEGVRRKKALVLEAVRGFETEGCILLVGNRQSWYYLGGGVTRWGRGNGVSTLLLWEAYLRLKESTKWFDFEGSMIPSVEWFFRGFGAQMTAYSRVWKNLVPAQNEPRCQKECPGWFSGVRRIWRR